MFGVLSASNLFAQSAVVGGLGNFDAANYEGKDAHGLEVQVEGITPGDLSPSWCGNKYNCPQVIPYATGVYVRYKSGYDATTGTWLATTISRIPGAFAGTCYMGSPAYSRAGCDHFGVHIAYPASTRAQVMSYRWLFEDPANPGTLVPSTNNIFVPTPVYTWVPPAQPTAPPTLVVVVQTPPPPPPVPAVPPQYGDATWVKVFKTEHTRDIRLDELVETNPAVVPEDATQVETEWKLMQPEPPSDGNRKGRNRHQNQGGVGPGVRSVVRRYETYAYTGAYDPTNHQAICGGDGTCNIPQAGELGGLLNAQMAAANVDTPSLTVTMAGAGAGQVASTDKVIACGNKCASNYLAGTAVTLQAKADSKSTFAGWTGACTGTGDCTVTPAGATTVTANFAAQATGGGGGGGGSTTYTLQVKNSNPGTITSDVGGINCGSICSAKVNPGTVVTLTATPPAGKSFLGWSGACSGTANTCVLNVNANLSAQANYSK